ncbi:MAG: tRNA(Ile)-lysidine synthetase, partial [Deltaproteobacteria bacterium]
ALVAHAGDEARVATGHTLDDQAETVLQRLLRGAGLRGLAAIPWREGRLVRPLLAVRRAETRALGLPFCDDPSNATHAYQRNRLRHDVLPLLEAENPRAAWALAEVADQARAELELVDALADAVDLTRADLAGTTPELAEVLLRWRHRREVGGAPPGRGAAAQLARQLVAGVPDGKTSLGGGVSGRARGGRLGFEDERDPRLEVVAHGTGHYRLGTLRLELSSTSTPTGPVVDEDTPLVAMLPAEGLRWPLRIRKTSAASRMNPARRTVQVDAPGRPDVADSQRGAPSTEYVITDALGARVWPPAKGAPPVVEPPLIAIVARRGG